MTFSLQQEGKYCNPENICGWLYQVGQKNEYTQ